MPVTEVELEYGINSGIRLKGVAASMVPIHEEHEARLERGINLETWMAMSMSEKALIVAVRRNRIAIQNIQSDTEVRHTKREMRTPRR